jgi:hypothetical protein
MKRGMLAHARADDRLAVVARGMLAHARTDDRLAVLARGMLAHARADHRAMDPSDSVSHTPRLPASGAPGPPAL